MAARMVVAPREPLESPRSGAHISRGHRCQEHHAVDWLSARRRRPPNPKILLVGSAGGRELPGDRRGAVRVTGMHFSPNVPRTDAPTGRDHERGIQTPEAGRPADTDREVVETVRRIMGEDPPDATPAPAADSRPGPGYSATPPVPAVYAGTPSTAPGNGTAARPTTDSGLSAGASNGTGHGSQPTTEVAKEQAADVADSAKQAGTQVAQTVKEQAAGVTNEAGRQAKQLLAEAQSELSEQAAQQQQKVAGGLHALADELDGMVRGSEQDGVATDLARQAAEKARQIGTWLEDRDPGSLLDEVRDFGRRRPGAYLAIAAGAGILAGRLTRGLSASNDSIPTQRTISHPGVDRPAPVTAAGPEALTGQSSPPGATAGQSLQLDRGGYPHGSGQGVPAPTGLPAQGDDVTDPPMQVAPGPVPGLGATNVVGGPRGDLTR